MTALTGDGPTAERLVVVAGTAGVGKTTLAVRFAHTVSARFADGQLFVNLRGYDPDPPLSAAAVLERFLRALGVEASGVPAEVEERAEMYRSLLAGRRMLVVLDNAATVGQVRPLLPGEAGCLVVVTSRGRLSGLSARDGARRIALGLLPESDAVTLVDGVTAGYRDGDEPGQVVQLVRLCARLPLALRLAAERAAARPLMPLRDLIADLRGQSSLWEVLSVEDATEADAVRSVFAWSYRALPTSAARLFRLLGLHTGPEFTVGAAAALAGEPSQRVGGLLDVLAGAHLLQQAAPGRYQFHDLLRAYAADQARQQDSTRERQAALVRVAQWYLHNARAAALVAQDLFHLPPLEAPDEAVQPVAFTGYAAAMDWFVAERANLLALARIMASQRLDRMSWQLPATAHELYLAHGAIDDYLEITELGLRAADRLGDVSARAAMLQAAGLGYRAAGRHEQAAGAHRVAQQLYAELDEREKALEAGVCLGVVHLDRRDLDEAVVCFEQTLAAHGDHTPSAWNTIALMNLALAYIMAGRLELAAELAERALHRVRHEGLEPRVQIEPILVLAWAHREAGRLDLAEQQIHDAMGIIGGGVVYRSVEHAVLLEQVALALARGEGEQALEISWGCALLARELGDRRREARSLDAIGQALLHLGRADEAADFHRTAAAIARAHTNKFETAAILGHLAASDQQSGRVETARAASTEALQLLDAYSDPRAQALRDRLQRS